MSSRAMHLYDKAPILLQNAAVSGQGILNRRRRHGREYWQWREILDTRCYEDLGSLRRMQDRQFVRLVNFAARNSPFYQDFYRGLDLSQVRGVADAAILPILSKEMVRANAASMYTALDEPFTKGSTSGTTGTPFVYKTYDRDLQWRLAYLDSFKARHGFENLKMRRASFASPKIVPSRAGAPFWRDNLPNRQRFYSSYHLTGETVGDFAESLIRYAPRSIDGYPSAIAEVARHMTAEGLRFEEPPTAVFPTAETLYEKDRHDIERAFETVVLDQYASSEGAPFIVMCEEGNRHYCLDTGVIEAGEDGEALVTGFGTRGTPLIRYAIGDRLTLADESASCRCGSALPLVDSIEGRTNDYIVGATGRKIPAALLSLVSEEFEGGIRAMQFVQERQGEVVVLVEPAGAYSTRMEAIIREKLAFSLGAETAVELRLLPEIPRTSNGKFQLVVNRVVAAPAA